MKKLYELCDLEKIILKRLKERGYKYIYHDSLDFVNLMASVKKPILDEVYNILQVKDYKSVYVGFDIFFDFIKFPRVYRIESLLSNDILYYDED